MKIIHIFGTNINITVNSAEEMYSMFFQLLPRYDLEVDAYHFPKSTNTIYTRDYFQKRFF